MKLFASIALSFCLCCCFNAKAASFEWPKTPAAKVFEAFVIAYNTGSAAKIETFVKAHYGKSGAEYVAQKTEYWLDIFYRFGPVRAHSLSINQPLDLEVWVQGTTSKAWFAPEFLLNKTTHKIRATGMMTGEQPQGTATPAPSDKAFLANLIDYLSANENSGLFHGAVLVQHHNQTVLSQAYGFKNIAQKQKNSVTTKMRLASVAKPITAVAAIQLVQKGLLDLHTPVSKYLPELPKQIGDNITIFQLLSHTSGYELDGIDGFREALQKTHSMAEVYATQLKFLPQWQHYQAFEVSNKFDYANDSYDLVAIIIEKISGLRFETYIKQHIFDV
ncbi:MAG: beta-lactamase family protein, partial [Algicola sp.]|nr:beta-lactamase family protein [Algicola sp.]